MLDGRHGTAASSTAEPSAQNRGGLALEMLVARNHVVFALATFVLIAMFVVQRTPVECEARIYGSVDSRMARQESANRNQWTGASRGDLLRDATMTDDGERFPIPVVNETDVKFLLHILKTGGTTLSDMFSVMFAADEIMPGSNRSESIPQSMRTKYFRYPPDPPGWQVGFAHEPMSFARRLPFPVAPITIIRNPTTHYRSVWKSPVFSQCKPPTARTFDEWIESDLFLTCAYIQTATLCEKGTHYMGPAHPVTPPAQAVEEAKRNLASMAWFGITDRWTESMCLMYYTFGWRPLPGGEVEPQRMRHDTEIFPQATLERLHKVAWADYELYKFGERIFDGRIRQMRYEMVSGNVPEGRPHQSLWPQECIDLFVRRE